MIKADMKIYVDDEKYYAVYINYFSKMCEVNVYKDTLELFASSKVNLKSLYGEKKYRQIRDDVLNYVKQYMENKDDKTTI